MRYVSRSLGIEYFEIAKSACTSIKAALLEADGVEGVTEHVHTHPHWRDVPNDIPISTRFTFVRHPFERIKSSWREKLKRGLAKRLGGSCPLDESATLAQWVRWVTSQNPENCDKHWTPQCEILRRQASREQIPDWIGKIDDNSHERSWRALQAKHPGLPNLTRKNASEPADGDAFSCDAFLRAKKFFVQDTAMFWYDVEPYRPADCVDAPVNKAPSVIAVEAYTRPDDETFLDRIKTIGGWMFKQEMLWLRHQARTRERIVEVGVWKGRSLFALASTTPGVAIGVDHWLGSPNELATTHRATATSEGSERIYKAAQDNLAEFIESGKCKLIKQESTEAAKEFDKEIDMLFLDSGHDYESCAADLNAWAHHVKDGGLICGHDYKPHLGCYRAVNDFFGAENVKRATGSIWYIEPTEET